MSEHKGRCPFSSRRSFLAAAGWLAGAFGAGVGMGDRQARAAVATAAPSAAPSDTAIATEPFWGKHQSGILTPTQSHTYFAAFDLITEKASDIEALLRLWTQAASRIAAGETAEPLGGDLSRPAGDSSDALGLGPARLTLTFGFGLSLFVKDGKDRYGLAAQRPAALVDMPSFNGDQLVAAQTGGDLSVQACADDPQVAFHAVRQLARLAYGVAQLRWVQTGFSSEPKDGETPRNLMGFRDGTQNPIAPPPNGHGIGTTRPGLAPDKVVWVGDEGPAWMRGGSYLVVRRIRISLEHWDRTDVDFQEQVIGRHKISGAPLGGHDEFEALDLRATDKDGNFVTPDNAHVRMGAAASNDGAQILRRGYSYNDGVTFVAERWPPWHQGMLYDAGLLFIAYQRDPRTGFIKIFDTMSKLDAMNQFTTHIGSGLFACPHGATEGQFIGQELFQHA
ncbi:MAG: iron uptake transporter deferrochelatase/peroxidase subunit [Methylovirgula sp.]